MVKLCLIAIALSMMASPVSAQESKSATRPAERTIILDIQMVEVNLTRTQDMERIAKQEDRLNESIAAGKARLIASLQIRARSGEQSAVRIGQRVPVQTGTLPAVAIPSDRQRRARNQQTASDSAGVTDAFGALGIPQIQYENTGIVVNALPRLVGELIEVKLNFEMTGLQNSTGSLTPTFIQRTVNEVARLRDGETALLLGILQHETLSSSFAQPPAGQASNQSRGSFVVLLSARLID